MKIRKNIKIFKKYKKYISIFCIVHPKFLSITPRIILHRIISVVYLTGFFTRNLDSIHPRWRVTTLTSEREAGRECNRSGGLYSRPLMTVPIVTLLWWMEEFSVFRVVVYKFNSNNIKIRDKPIPENVVMYWRVLILLMVIHRSP